jgi:hypothetical protein
MGSGPPPVEPPGDQMARGDVCWRCAVPVPNGAPRFLAATASLGSSSHSTQTSDRDASGSSTENTYEDHLHRDAFDTSDVCRHHHRRKASRRLVADGEQQNPLSRQNGSDLRNPPAGR